MGIYNTIPAYNINATYNVITQTLTLTALVEVGKSTTGFGFKMMTLSKGLKFILGAHTPIMDKDNHTYQFSESFKIQLPANTLLSEAITIITQNEPYGELVPIYFVGMFQESELLPIAAQLLTNKVAPSTKRRPVAKPKNTPLNDSFTLNTSARVAEFAFV